ncbi:MAG: S41 family peptidase [Candidatus Gracilibacteria bacterium]
MKNINKILSFIIFTTILTLNFNIADAGIIGGTKITITAKSEINDIITRTDIFNFFAKYYNGQILESYKYIQVNFKDVEKGSTLEDSLKKLIYLNLIENPNRELDKDSELNAWGFFRLSEKILGIKINDVETKTELVNRNTTAIDIQGVSDFIGNRNISIDSKSTNKEVKQKLAILNDVYKTIISSHYDKDILDEGKIIDSAISGITNGTNDKHTVYFPPLDSESFHDSLSGDYEGIGSYVDMEKPGAVRIVSPIPGSPSEKAGLKGGDLIIKVDGREITEKNSLKEVITWIKGPANTKVTLTIDRNGKIFDVDVMRERIIITDIESEVLNTTTYYLQIKSFGEHVSDDFERSLKELKELKNVNKIILDLRNNGGGYLDEVAEILSYFVEEGKGTAVVKYHDSEKNFVSKGYDLIDFNKYKIIVLQNSGTASASEILIGTLKDYYPDIEIIGENSYGKGSVQILKGYTDGSLLKYTIAKWFTGLTQTGIDGIGIKPTIELEFDLENYNKNGFDNQLDKAKFIN